MSAEFDIIENGHPLEQLDVLKGARNAQFGNAVRGQVGNIAAFVEDLALLRGVEPADAVEQAGFPGAIGADDRKNFSGSHFTAYPAEGLDTPKRQMDLFYFDDGFLVHSGYANAMVVAG